MKKDMKKVILILIMGCLLFTLCSCIGSDNTSNVNDLGGSGKFKEIRNTKGNNGICDEDAYYFECWYNGNSGEVLDEYLGLSKDGKLQYLCKDASCNHESINCKANSNLKNYFCLDGRLLVGVNIDKNNTTEGKIVDPATNETIYEPELPEELKNLEDDEYDTHIQYFGRLDEKRILIVFMRFAYILDNDYNVLQWYKDVGKTTWYYLDGDNYYFVNKLFKINCLNLNTGEITECKTEEFVITITNYGDVFYFVNDYEELYSYSLDTKEEKFIMDFKTYFAAVDNYLYYTIEKDEGTSIYRYDILENKDEEVLQIDGTTDLYSSMFAYDEQIFFYDFEGRIYLADKKMENVKTIEIN